MKTYSKADALALSAKIIEAEEALKQYLRQSFPTGARCEAFLRYGQLVPTKATIRGVNSTRYGGEVIIEIDTAKPNSRQRYRSISAESVIYVQPQGGAA